MSRTTSAALKTAVFSQETNKVFLVLLTIQHADIGSPDTLYFVNNYEDVSSGGDTYTAYPFMINLPGDIEDQLTQVQLVIDNVDRSIVEAIRTLTGPPTVTLSVVLSDTPDVIEAGPFEMTLRNTEWDAITVSGSLQPQDILNEPYPGDGYTPQNFPGMF